MVKYLSVKSLASFCLSRYSHLRPRADTNVCVVVRVGGRIWRVRTKAQARSFGAGLGLEAGAWTRGVAARRLADRDVVCSIVLPKSKPFEQE